MTLSDDGLNGDQPWLSLDSPHPRNTNQDFQMNNTRQGDHQDKRYDDLPPCTIPGMHYV